MHRSPQERDKEHIYKGPEQGEEGGIGRDRKVTWDAPPYTKHAHVFSVDDQDTNQHRPASMSLRNDYIGNQPR